MPERSEWRTRVAVCLLYAATVCCGALSASWAHGAENDEKSPSKEDKRPDHRLNLMREAIDGLRITSKQTDSDGALKFSARPLLRYNDGTRGVTGVLDATAWRLGESGRPKAIATLEIYPVNQAVTLLQYEFVSLASDKFELQNQRGVRWLPHGAKLSMTTVTEASAPGATPKARLVQLRALARRFAAQEVLRSGARIELRLLSQPIDRYDDPAADILDGAVFVFANGTNPEVGLLLECSEQKWSYGFFRLAAATLLAQLDGESVLESAAPPRLPVDAPYMATGRPITLPEEHDGG